jgi:hypothetical protein
VEVAPEPTSPLPELAPHLLRRKSVTLAAANAMVEWLKMWNTVLPTRHDNIDKK